MDRSSPIAVAHVPDIDTAACDALNVTPIPGDWIWGSFDGVNRRESILQRKDHQLVLGDTVDGVARRFLPRLPAGDGGSSMWMHISLCARSEHRGRLAS